MRHRRPLIPAQRLTTCAALAATAAAALACPVSNRYPADISDGQASQNGGAFVNGARAADDFFIPLGNGNNYNARVLKAVLFSNQVLTPTSVGIAIYADATTGTPSRPVPGAIVSGPPNASPQVRDLGIIPAPGFRAYEISYLLPPGMLQLAPNRWYWLAPYALANSSTSATYSALSGASTIVREPINKSFGSAAAPNTYTSWTLTTDCCLGGPYDMAMYVDAVQIGASPADFNCSLSVSNQDLFDFLAAYFGGLPGGDFNGSGTITVQDIFDFLAAFFSS